MAVEGEHSFFGDKGGSRTEYSDGGRLLQLRGASASRHNQSR
jgi:hypothetical protein